MTRQELYDLVWSAPMSVVAKKIGISDKSIATRCQRHRVPTPSRGYWTQAAANRAGPRPPLEGDAGEAILIERPPAASRTVRANSSADQVHAGASWPFVDSSAGTASAMPSPDMPLLSVLAGELQVHGAMTALVDRVASRALSMSPERARLLLDWVTAVREELERSHPAARLMQALQQRC